ncbi:hypothetical protein DPB93_22960 [Salmonella enterica subsp. salamae]|nr:hypothetical protein [Salmonella enterica subsp. salamae]ECI4078436.1 hypothetical protein [Salmonella enterica subsp. salamae]
MMCCYNITVLTQFFPGSFPASWSVTGRQPRRISLLMKIFHDPFPVPHGVIILIFKYSHLKKTGSVHILSK